MSLRKKLPSDRWARASTSFRVSAYSDYHALVKCGLTVDAGSDVAFRPGGSVVQLNGNVAGPNVTGFTWHPTTGLDNPNSLTPSATITAPVTYTLTAEVFDPTANLIVNGDFEAGNSGLRTIYLPGFGGPFCLLSRAGHRTVPVFHRRGRHLRRRDRRG